MAQMAENYMNERSRVLEWFETDFKDTAKSTTRTSRLEDGRVNYRFSVINNSGVSFERFSFKVKILNKADGTELGTATINAGEWAEGERKNFKSKINIPPDVKSISFVMFSESVDYEAKPADLVSAIKDIGDMVTGSDGSGGVFGELFGTGGMPETTVTKTTTTTTPHGTTTTRTTTTTRGGSTVRRETTTSRQSRPRSPQSGQTGARRQTKAGPQPKNGRQTFAQRKNEKRLNKKRLGKSGWTVTALVMGILMAMAAMGSADDPQFMIQCMCMAVASFGVAGGLKFYLSNKAKRIRAYETKVNRKGNTSLDDLAEYMHRPVDKVADDLQKMIVDGFFGEAYIDINNRMLVMTRNGEPLESVEKSAASFRKLKRKEARDKGVVPESIDDLITMTDDTDIKSKLKSLRTITRKIDQRIEERPELEDQVKEFREKYYPEVVRLTDEYNEKIANIGKYAEEKPEPDPDKPVIDANPNYLQEQAAEIKVQLISLIDSVAEASENILEKLHEDDIMDISTDIKMLQTTLASKGLLDSDFDL